MRTQHGFALAERVSHAFVREALRVAEHKKRDFLEEKKWREIGRRRLFGDDIALRFEQLVEKKEQRVFLATRARQKRRCAY